MVSYTNWINHIIYIYHDQMHGRCQNQLLTSYTVLKENEQPLVYCLQRIFENVVWFMVMSECLPRKCYNTWTSVCHNGTPVWIILHFQFNGFWYRKRIFCDIACELPQLYTSGVSRLQKLVGHRYKWKWSAQSARRKILVTNAHFSSIYL